MLPGARSRRKWKKQEAGILPTMWMPTRAREFQMVRRKTEKGRPQGTPFCSGKVTPFLAYLS